MSESSLPAPAVTVLKIGGRSLGPGGEMEAVLGFLDAERAAGRGAVIVHGGGDAVTEAADRRGLPTIRDRGQRVTSPEMMEVVLEVLGGRINSEVASWLRANGIPSCGILAAEGGTLTVRPAGTPPGSLGKVGLPDRVDPKLLRTLFAEGYVPVLAPIGADGLGGLSNVNADLVAGAIASALGAPLLLLTDVPAVRDRTGRALPELTPGRAKALLKEGVATDGMIPKLEAALDALTEGCPSVWIGGGADLTPAGPRPGAGTRLAAAAPPRTSPVPLLARRSARGRAR